MPQTVTPEEESESRDQTTEEPETTEEPDAEVTEDESSDDPFDFPQPGGLRGL